MDFLEKDLEQIIYETSDDRLFEKGLNLSGRRFRQLRIGNYGIADMVTFERKYKEHFNYQDQEPYYVPFLEITVYELKKDKVGVHTFFQSVKYCRGIDRYLKSRESSANYEFNVVLIGRDYDSADGFIYLPDLISPQENSEGHINTVSILTYNYTFDGLFFQNHSGYKLINEGF